MTILFKQRALAAKDLANAIRGCVLAALIKFLPLFLMVIPGMIARVLIPEVKDDPNSAYILLITKLAPPGLKGLLLSAIIAALMSSLASLFHSSSTLFTMDFYRVVREYFDKRRIMQNAQQILSTPREGNVPAAADPNSSEFDLPNRNTEYVVVGKLAGAVVTVIGLLFIPVVQVLSKQLYIYTHKSKYNILDCSSNIGGWFLFLKITLDVVCEFPSLLMTQLQQSWAIWQRQLLLSS